ncbi:hypothetical protein V1294_000396 [Bradyrhizobium sp. AZCC 1678]|uniref:hypothetical protein n=1 Tax=Bradyrhizobium sp. AZCC 1678 TaxID=3117030 RepID=UPI002FF2A754
MASHRRSVLPPPLAAKLAALGNKLGQSDDELEDVLAELSALPANEIVPASREIATAVRFGWWREQNGFLLPPLFGGAASTPQLLRKNHDYAWLFLFHPSGYAREAALDSINDPPASAFFFATLAWRLNDWVRPVRQAALRCAERVLHQTTTDVAAKAALYLLDRRLVWGRWTDEANILDSVFGRRDVIAGLATHLQGQSTGAVATCLRSASRYPDIDEHLPHIAAAAVQPSVRAVAYQWLIAGKATWPVGFEWAWIDKVYGLRRRIPVLASRDIRATRPAAEWIREGIHDKSAFVRRIAADALVGARAQIPDADNLIAHLAKDRSPAIRSRADFMLRHPLSAQS